jgi:redox-sensitive bicupin YhaK (pirin superfamily)
MPIEVRPAGERFVTRAEGRTTWHSFSFGVHYDPHNVGFGALVAHNDERLPAGTGYPDHPHSDIEIVTCVLSGALRHTDTAGHTGVLVPGEVQVLSAGSGVVHSEVSDAAEETRFVQAWVRPDESGLVPSYAVGRIELDDSLRCLAAGAPSDALLRVHTRGASLHAARLDRDARVALPDAPRLHVFVASGAVVLGDHELGPDDTGRLLNEAGRTLSATRPDTRILVWAFC